MNYGTAARALEAAAELNKDKGHPEAHAVQDERGVFTVVRAYCIERWLQAHSARRLVEACCVCGQADGPNHTYDTCVFKEAR